MVSLDKEKLGNIMKSEKFFIGVLVLLVVGITSAYLYFTKEEDIIKEKDVAGANSKSADVGKVPSSQPEKNNQSDEIKVYVVGAVNKPGVVVMKKGQIVQEAIDLAGGFREDAKREDINLVYKLTENVMMKVHGKNDKLEGNTPLPNGTQTGVEFVREPRGVTLAKTPDGKAPSGGASGGADSSGGMVNLNTASKEQLMSLPGVGPSTADKIIQFREKSGGFQKKEDLKNVPGIGDAKFNAVKDAISVD